MRFVLDIFEPTGDAGLRLGRLDSDDMKWWLAQRGFETGVRAVEFDVEQQHATVEFDDGGRLGFNYGGRPPRHVLERHERLTSSGA